MIDLPPLKPYQTRTLAEIGRAINAGCRRIVVQAPTGAGKTRCFLELARIANEHSRRVVLYTHRRLLTAQNSDKMEEMGIQHGFLAHGYDLANVGLTDIASIWTVGKRVKAGHWELPAADMAIVDEAHAFQGETARSILDQHHKAGATIVGFSATPTNAGSMWDLLIQATTNSELRACGMHLPCYTFAPDEPDLHKVKRHYGGEYVVKEMRKRIMVPGIVGRIYDHLVRLNPDLRPTILFAPCRRSSNWLAQRLSRRGIAAAHIDCETPLDEREDIIAALKEGRIKVLCNRWLLREGVDIPELYCCVLATAFGATSTYLQAAGRLLRSHPSLPGHVLLQDHGGNWTRHGSLNDDRIWDLTTTNKSMSKERIRKFREGEASEPIRCPRCGGIRRGGPACPHCGHKHKLSCRLIVESDGKLVRKVGTVIKKKANLTDEEKAWFGVFWPCLYNGGTFFQATAWFRKKYGRNPTPGLRWLPEQDSPDMKKRIREVLPHLYKRRKT